MFSSHQFSTRSHLLASCIHDAPGPAGSAAKSSNAQSSSQIPGPTVSTEGPGPQGTVLSLLSAHLPQYRSASPAPRYPLCLTHGTGSICPRGIKRPDSDPSADTVESVCAVRMPFIESSSPIQASKWNARMLGTSRLGSDSRTA